MAHKTDGTYIVRFKSSLGWEGSGVATLSDMTVSGGDSAFLFNGDFRSETGKMIGSLSVQQHSPSMISIFGPLSKFTIDLVGNINGEVGEFEGNISGQPDLKVNVRLKRTASIAA